LRVIFGDEAEEMPEHFRDVLARIDVRLMSDVS